MKKYKSPYPRRFRSRIKKTSVRYRGEKRKAFVAAEVVSQRETREDEVRAEEYEGMSADEAVVNGF